MKKLSPTERVTALEKAIAKMPEKALTKQSPEKPIYPSYDDQDYPICPRCTNELPNDDFFGLL